MKYTLIMVVSFVVFSLLFLCTIPYMTEEAVEDLRAHKISTIVICLIASILMGGLGMYEDIRRYRARKMNYTDMEDYERMVGS